MNATHLRIISCPREGGEMTGYNPDQQPKCRLTESTFRDDRLKPFFSKLLNLLAGWLTAGCCSSVKHCSPGLRKVVPQRSHNNVVNSYGSATRARPGPPVDVGIRHTVLQCALFTPPEAVPEAGLNLPHVAILSIAGLRRAWSLETAPREVVKGRAVADPDRSCTRNSCVRRAAEVFVTTVEPQIQLRGRVQLEADQRLIREYGDNRAVRTQGYVTAIRRSVAADAPATHRLYCEVELLRYYRQDKTKAQAATPRHVIVASQAVTEEPAECFDFVVAPAGLKGDLGDEIRGQIRRDAGRARGVAECETTVR